jgi:uncharacterized membrane protein YqiK
MHLTIATPDQSALVKDAESLLALASEIVIDSDEMYEIADGELKSVKKRLNGLEDQRKRITGPLDQAKKEIIDLFRAPTELLSKAEVIIKRAMVTYSDEQEKKRRLEEARLAELAKQERARLEAQAESARKAAAEEAEAIRKAAEEAAAAGNAEAAAALESEAAFTESSAETAAEAIVAEADLFQAQVALAPATPKVAGTSIRETWHFVVEDKLTLVQFVAANPQFLNLLDVNQSAGNALARSLKKDMRVDGAKAVPKRDVAARA